MRYRAILQGRYRAIVSYTALILLIAAGVILAPLLLLFFRPEERFLWPGFAFPGLILAAVSFALWRSFRPRRPAALSVADGGVIVVLSWMIAMLAGAVPFLLSGRMGFTPALFESVSGWTTTGLSVVDVEAAPGIILLYRSLLQFAGGAGFAIIMLASLTGPPGLGLLAAEGRTDQLVPQVRRSAKLVFGLYIVYNLAGIAALAAAGMGLFDAVNHSLAALSTGGFSTRAESIGAWGSLPVEAVTIVLMVLGNLSFLTGYTLLHGRFRAVGRNGEVRLQAYLIPLFAAVLFFFVTRSLYPTLGQSVRTAVFETVTALTTTGYSITSYGRWPALGWVVIIALMIIGGGGGSTAGGIKQFRVYILARAVAWEIAGFFRPRTAVGDFSVWQGDRRVFIESPQVRRVAVFCFSYLVILFAGTTIIAAYGYPLRESLFEFASALGTVGLSIGITGPAAPAGVLWTGIFGMFLGRLEFFVIIVGLVRIISDLPLLLSRREDR